MRTLITGVADDAPVRVAIRCDEFLLTALREHRGERMHASRCASRLAPNADNERTPFGRRFGRRCGHQADCGRTAGSRRSIADTRAHLHWSWPPGTLVNLERAMRLAPPGSIRTDT